MRATTGNAVRPARLALLWLGIQLAWGAILGISLQARSAGFDPHDPLGAFARVSIPGAIAAAIAQLVAGPFSDRLRRDGDRRLWFYGVGALVGSMGVIGFYLAPNLQMLTVAYVSVQVAFNVVIGPYQAIVPDFVERPNIGTASAWMAAMQSAGNAIGAVLATLLGNTVFLGAVIAVTVVACASATCAYVRALPLQTIVGDQRLVRSMSLVDLFISRAFVYLGFYTLLSYLYFYVAALLPHGFALNATTASGACILLFTLVGAAGAAFAARPADRLDERLVVTVGGGIVAVAIAVLAVAPFIVALPFAIALAGVGWGVFLCADWAFACRVLPGGALASAMAVWNIAVVGPQVVAPILVSALLARLGTLQTPSGPRDAFALAALEILIGALWIWRLPQDAKGK